MSMLLLASAACSGPANKPITSAAKHAIKNVRMCCPPRTLGCPANLAEARWESNRPDDTPADGGVTLGESQESGHAALSRHRRQPWARVGLGHPIAGTRRTRAGL